MTVFLPVVLFVCNACIKRIKAVRSYHVMTFLGVFTFFGVFIFFSLWFQGFSKIIESNLKAEAKTEVVGPCIEFIVFDRLRLSRL